MQWYGVYEVHYTSCVVSLSRARRRHATDVITRCVSRFRSQLYEQPNETSSSVVSGSIQMHRLERISPWWPLWFRLKVHWFYSKVPQVFGVSRNIEEKNILYITKCIRDIEWDHCTPDVRQSWIASISCLMMRRWYRYVTANQRLQR